MEKEKVSDHLHDCSYAKGRGLYRLPLILIKQTIQELIKLDFLL